MLLPAADPVCVSRDVHTFLTLASCAYVYVCRDEFTNYMFLQKAQAAGDEGDADNWRLFPADFRDKTSATSMHHEQVRSSCHKSSRLAGAGSPAAAINSWHAAQLG
jgi:hypothetical protein